MSRAADPDEPLATPRSIAIVGASAAGLAVGTALRDENYDGRIVLIGAESEPPYDRPPLSKRRLLSESDLDSILLADETELTNLDLDLRLGATATALDPEGRRLELANGETIAWDACVIATGAAPISLPGAAQVLRSFQDSLAIAHTLGHAQRLLIVGAGVLGCELAALARGADVGVTVVDRLAGPMIDRLGSLVSERLEKLHREQGVDFRFGTTVASIDGEGEGGRRVTFRDGTRTEVDAVFVAIGCRPNVAWLRGSGLPLQDGVLCDEFCRAAPGIYAAGDVARWFCPRYGRHLRVEHRTNASEQGMAVAKNLLGAETPYDPIPFFWTDQYDTKIQVQGLVGAESSVDLLQDEEGALLAAYNRDGRIEGLLGWNRAKALRQARTMIGQQRSQALEAFA